MSVFVLLLLGFEAEEDDELEGVVEELEGVLLLIELLVSVLLVLPVVVEDVEGVVV